MTARGIRSLRRASWAGITLLVALGGITAGCSGTTAGREPNALPQVTATPVVLDSAHLKLPLEAYLLSAREMDDLTAARDIFLNRCSHRFGVTMPAPPKQRHLAPITYTERRYGVADPELAAEDGYHLGVRDPRNAGELPRPRLSAEQELVLTGTPPPTGTPHAKAPTSPQSKAPQTHVRGRKVPTGGCLGEADRRFGGSWANPDLVEEIDATSVVKATEDRRVRATFRAWSACMKAKGLRYSTPWDPANDPRFTGAHSSPTEITVATADVACKKKTNVIGVWYAVDAAYQRALIERNQAALDQTQRDKAAHLRIAAAALRKR